MTIAANPKPSSQTKIAYKPKAPWTQNSHFAHFMKKHGLATPQDLLTKSQNDGRWFWTECLKEISLHFRKPFDEILAGEMPSARWAVGGEISIVENCIDRHLATKAKAPAFFWESDTGDQSKTWTFEDLARETVYVAREFLKRGAKPGDRVALLMPMSLEMVAAFFGALRAGLSVIPIFSGFGAEAIASRLQDSKTRFVCIQEKTTRRGKEINVRATLEEALRVSPSVEDTLVFKRDEFLKGHCVEDGPFMTRDSVTGAVCFDSVALPSEAEVLYLYTSGTTGKPKACVHTPFGVLATTGKELRFGFDLREGDRFFWYTDIGWMMGPWELFGALQYSIPVMLYEGVPDFPEPDRLWKIIDDYKITHLGISPTAIRVLKKADEKYLQNKSLETLRILGSTGEPWDEESWHWFFEKIGKTRCPILNISGGTEIMGCLLMPHPLSELKPCSLGGPALGAAVEAWSEDGEKITEGLGHLVCRSPLPSMTKGFLNSYERYRETYFSKFDAKTWYHGDWAFIDRDGFWFLKGRSDDTIKIAGKRIGPNEFESALMKDTRIAESAAVGIPHALKGESVICFVVLKNDCNEASKPELKKELHKLVADTLGKAFSAEDIRFVSALPKTRSGKILRGLMRKVILNEPYDLAAVENPQSVEELKERIETKISNPAQNSLK